jgi:hypothetical protein
MNKLFLIGLFAIAAANASISPDLVISGGDVCVVEGPNCRYEYTASLPANHYLQNGDFFTIYDFGGFVGGIMNPTGWSGTAALLGDTPINPSATPNSDDPQVTNITWTYTGSTSLNSGNFPISGFSALSSFRFATIGEYASQAHKLTPPSTVALPDSKVGPVGVPLPTGSEPGDVPEPMSMALLGSGLGLLGVLRLRKE